MPIQLVIWERRDNGNREIMANSALELCRIIRKREGITSSRFYWSGSEAVVFLTEGEAVALNAPLAGLEAVPADYTRLGFVLADNARQTLNMRLAEPRAADASYRAAGRLK
jgi:hypothetical protein